MNDFKIDEGVVPLNHDNEVVHAHRGVICGRTQIQEPDMATDGWLILLDEPFWAPRATHLISVIFVPDQRVIREPSGMEPPRGRRKPPEQHPVRNPFENSCWVPRGRDGKPIAT